MGNSRYSIIKEDNCHVRLAISSLTFVNISNDSHGSPLNAYIWDHISIKGNPQRSFQYIFFFYMYLLSTCELAGKKWKEMAAKPIWKNV